MDWFAEAKEIDAASAALETWIASQDLSKALAYTILANVLAKHCGRTAKSSLHISARLAALELSLPIIAEVEFRKTHAKT